MKNKEEKIHPCQKPVALYEWLLTKYAKNGDKILDTHLGSMSVIACHNLGFEITGCELDEDYFNAGIGRKSSQRNSKGYLFDIQIIQQSRSLQDGDQK